MKQIIAAGDESDAGFVIIQHCAKQIQNCRLSRLADFIGYGIKININLTMDQIISGK